MLQGYYSAASGMRAALQNQDVLAQNLAHASVPGYRRQGLSFASYVATGSAPADGSKAPAPHGAAIAQHASSFVAGPIQQTGNPLECALQGDGFFVLDGPKGPMYTRNGQFQLNAGGRLVNQSGYPVRGVGAIPQSAAKIQIAQDGTVMADSTSVGQLELVAFNDPKQLVRAGTTLFQAPPGTTTQAFTGTLRQGYREGSNVQVVHEMVQMISGMRQYEAAGKAMRSLSDAMQQRINAQM